MRQRSRERDREAGARAVVNAAIAERRLRNQLVTRARPGRPADVVGWFGAMQAQEYEAAKWAIGLRMQDGSVHADVERAFDQGRILRLHVMRPTWHFVAPADLRWLVQLTAPRVQRAEASFNRRLELDARTLRRGVGAIERSLRDHRYLTRTELGERLQRAGLPMAGQRLAQLMMHAELEAVVCSGPRREKRFTYALVDERVPPTPRVSRDEALASLCRRFFRSHGPATVRDFVWWSGLTTADARRGLDIVKARREEVDGRPYWTIGTDRPEATRDAVVHLLPIYDEYLNAYRDRDAVPHGPSVIASASPTSVAFRHALVIDGQVAGTWRCARRTQAVSVEVVPFGPITRSNRRALAVAVARYERFLGDPVTWSIAVAR